jgi:hypothetical protein
VYCKEDGRRNMHLLQHCACACAVALWVACKHAEGTALSVQLSQMTNTTA